MGAGFTRRYGYFPDSSEILAIEGVVIVDTPPPGRVEGVGAGVVAVVGEFTDMSYACKVNSSGTLYEDIRPVEILGGADLVDKVGGFDRYLGKFGTDGGNGWVTVRNKVFKRLVCVPVNLLFSPGDTQSAIRVWRDLPTNVDATHPLPIVPVQATAVPAGYEFRSGTDRVRLAQKVVFTAVTQKSSGVDGTTATLAVPAATTTVTRASGSWNSDGVTEGDILVPGSLNTATGTQNGDCALAGMLRIVSVDSDTVVTVQRLAGGNFTDTVNWRAGAALAYRVHKASDACTGLDHQLSEAAGYTVLARPLDNTIAAATALAPTTTPLSSTGSQWDVLSGLAAVTHPTVALTYTAAIQAPNAVSSATVSAAYAAAIDALLVDDQPANEVNIVVSARTTKLIRSKLRAHVLTSSSHGRGRMTVISPPLSLQSVNTAIASDDPGVGGGSGGAARDERVVYSWPGCLTFVPEAVGISITTADGSTTDDGMIDTTFDAWEASALSELQPELDVGQATDPIPQAFAYVAGYQRGCPKLDMSSYILLRQYGVSALRMDRTAGPIIQSAVTTSLTSGRTKINRRRFADFVQDSLAERSQAYVKQPNTQQKRDALLSEHDAFCAELLSDNNPSAQRIESYSLDDKSGNTEAMKAAGIHVIITKIRMLGILLDIVEQTDISPDTITTTAG